MVAQPAIERFFWAQGYSTTSSGAQVELRDSAAQSHGRSKADSNDNHRTLAPAGSYDLRVDVQAAIPRCQAVPANVRTGGKDRAKTSNVIRV